MKSFKQFQFESASHLSSEEQERIRKERVNQARKESSKRIQRAKEFAKRQREKQRQAKEKTIERLNKQRSDFEELKAKRQQRSKPPSGNASKVARGTYQLSKAVVKGIRRVIKKRQDKQQTGT